MKLRARAAHILLSTLFAMLLITAGCSPSPSPTDPDYYHDSGISASQMQQQNREVYGKLLTDLQLAPIGSSAADAGAAAEYRVAGAVSLLGYNYYDLQEHKDGTGTFTCILYRYTSGKIVLNISKNLTTEETKNLLDVIDANQFWSMTEVDPGLKMGLDGTTVLIEGYKGSKSHFVGRWCPDENTGAQKIFMAFMAFAGTFAKEPEATGS